jgi:hypothetical protein
MDSCEGKKHGKIPIKRWIERGERERKRESLSVCEREREGGSERRK